MTTRRRSWRSRPFLSLALRAGIYLGPVIVSALTASFVILLLPRPSGVVAQVGWWVAVVAIAVVTIVSTSALFRKALPLAALLQLTLQFPDEAPSRLRVVRTAHRTRDLKRWLEERRSLGEEDDHTRAAEAVLALIASLGEHDRRTRGHSERVRAFTDLLAQEVRIDQSDRDSLRWGALLHDIGKLTVPTEVLNKPGRPDEQEWEILKNHPIEGVRAIGPLREWLGYWAGAIEHHHEKWDGTGYPFGLRAEQISTGGRILAIADSFETMTALRPYKKPMSVVEARAELVRCAGKHFDPHLVRAFLNVSVRRLWWTVGLLALLAQIPLVGGAIVRPGGRRIAQGVLASGGVASAVVALATAGAIQLTPVPTGETSGGSRVGSASAAPREEPSDRPQESRRSVASGPDEDDLGGGIQGEGAADEDGSAADPIGEEEYAQDDHQTPTARPKEDDGEDDQAPPEGYEDQGRVVASSPLHAQLTGVTERDFLIDCHPPRSQGADAWVFTVPERLRSGAATARASGSSPVGYNLDLRFYSPTCRALGDRLQPDRDASAPMPSGTGFVVVLVSSGADTQIRLSVHARPTT